MERLFDSLQPTRWFAGLACLALIACSAPGQLVDARNSGRSGQFSESKLDAVTRIVTADIEARRIPGAVIMVARDGEPIYTRELGVRDPSTGAPMTQDSIFRLYSMSKPITSVGVMILVEEGTLDLEAPISRYLPELKDLRVAVDAKAGDSSTELRSVPVRRQMTTQDLLRHTSGFTYPDRSSPVGNEYVKAGVFEQTPGAGWMGLSSDADLIKMLAGAPLVHEPGSMWTYGFSTDVLGILIERVSGQRLDKFLAQRLFKPLQMDDTAFWIEPEKHGRAAEPFATDPDTNQSIRLWDQRRSRGFLGAGGGLVSTPRDYLRFAQMLLNGGTLDGVRVLSRKTVEFMTNDHLGGITGPNYDPGPGYGFGLGVAVRTARGVAAVNGSIGDYHWLGLGGTAFWVDPSERIVAVFMVQRFGGGWRYLSLFRNGLYSALR